MDRVNPQTNPALAAGNAPAWFGPTGSAGRVTTLTGMDRATGFSSLAGGTVTSRHPVTPGQPIASSVQIKPGFTGTVQVGCDFYSSTAYLSSISGAADVVNGVVQRIGVVGIVPAGAVEALLAVTHNGGPAQFTAHLPEVATAIGPYFDGASAATALQSAGVWDGTAGASTSRVTLLPQLVNSYPAEASGGVATLQTAQFTPRQNEVVLAYVTAGAPDVTLGAPAAPGLTFVEVDAFSAASYTPYRLFRADVGANPPSTSVTVSTTGATGTRAPTLIVERWSYAQLAASPALSTPRLSGTTGAPSATLTTVAANSVASWFCGDYAGVSTTTVTYRSSAVEKYRRRITSVINVWSAYQQAGAAGAQTIGQTAPSGQKWAMVGVELQPGPAPVEAALPSTAAERYGWGTALAPSDEFTGTAIDATRWAVYDGPGHAGNGVRSPAQVTVQDGYLRIAGTAGGASGGISQRFDQRFGRWEVRMRCSAVTPGSAGAPYHPVLIIWPTTEAWPEDGEYDWMENDEGQTTLAGFLHFPHPGPVPPNAVEQIGVTGPAIDLTQWHAYGFEWTNGRLKGYVDGNLWFDLDGAQTSSNGRRLDSMPGGHLTIQLDNNTGASGLRPATMDVDWARTYAVAESVPVTAVRPTGLASAEQAGAPAVTPTGRLAPAGISTGEQTGAPSVARGAVTVNLGGSGSAVPGDAVPGVAVPGQGAGTSGGGIGSGEQVGAPTVTTSTPVAVGGVASGEQAGGHTVFAGQFLLPTGLASAEQAGDLTVLRSTITVAPAGLATSEQPGGHAVQRGTVTASPAGLGSGEQLGGHEVLRGTVTAAPVGLGSAEQLGGHEVLRGTVDVAPAGLGSSEQPGGHEVRRGAVTAAPAGLASAELLGAHRVDLAVQPLTGVASGEQFGAVTVTVAAVFVRLAGLPTGERHGAPTMGVTAHLQPIDAGLELGAPTVLRGAVDADPAGLVSAERCGVPDVTAGVVDVAPAGLVSDGQAGAPAVLRDAVAVAPAGVASGEQPGAPTLSGGPITVAATSAATGPTVAAPTVIGEGVLVAPPAVASGEAFGAAVVAAGVATTRPPGVVSGAELGAPLVAAGAVLVRPAGVGPSVAVGAPVVSRGGVLVAPAGVASGDRYGTATVLAHRVLGVAAVTSGEQAGVPVVLRAARIVAPAPAPSASATGAPVVSRGAVRVDVAAVTSAEQLGAPSVPRAGVHLRPSGVPGAGESGVPDVGRGPVTVRPNGIAVVAVVVAPRLLVGTRTLTPAGVVSASAVGTPALRIHVDPAGIPAGRVGRPRVHGATRTPGALTASWRTGGGLTAGHTPT